MYTCESIQSDKYWSHSFYNSTTIQKFYTVSKRHVLPRPSLSARAALGRPSYLTHYKDACFVLKNWCLSIRKLSFWVKVFVSWIVTRKNVAVFRLFSYCPRVGAKENMFCSQFSQRKNCPMVDNIGFRYVDNLWDKKCSVAKKVYFRIDGRYT